MFLRLELPFSDNPKADCDAGHLLRAVFVCGNTWEDNLDGQLNGEWAAACERWMRKATKRKPDLGDATEVFRAHLADGYRMAPVWRHDSPQSVSMSAPWELLLKCRLVKAGFSLSDVMNGYLPERWYDYFTVCELEALQTCEDAGKWRQVFYTLEDAVTEAGLEAAGKEGSAQ